MARSVAWRRTISDAASWHQDEALNATIYILRENGPIGFLLKEEGDTKKYKVDFNAFIYFGFFLFIYFTSNSKGFIEVFITFVNYFWNEIKVCYSFSR